MKTLLTLVVLFLSLATCPGQTLAMVTGPPMDTIEVRVVLREKDTAHHRLEFQTPEYVRVPVDRGSLKQTIEGDSISFEILTNDSVLRYVVDYARNIYPRIYRGPGHFHQRGGKTVVKHGKRSIKCPLRFRTWSPHHRKGYQYPLKPGYYTYRAVLRNGVNERIVIAQGLLVVKVNTR